MCYRARAQTFPGLSLKLITVGPLGVICLASPRPPAKKLFARPCAYTMPMIHPLSFLQDSDSEQDEAAADPENPPCCAGSISSHAAAVPAAAAGPAVAARSHAAAEAATGMQSSSDEPPARKRMDKACLH